MAAHDLSRFAHWLEEELRRRDWTRADLARRAGLSRAAISDVLNLKYSPGPEFCRAVARALGYPQEAVFRRAGLLTDPPPSDDDPNIKLAVHLLRSLPPQARREILTFIRFKVWQQEQGERSE